MRKLILTVAAIVLLLSGCNGNANLEGGMDESFQGAVQETVAPTLAPEDSDFRNLKWGMTFDEVIATEGTGYKKLDDNMIRYSRIREEDLPADAEYEFTDNLLSGATFYIQPDYEDLNQYVEDYALLTRKFTKRYGAASSSEKSWAGENLEEETNKYGQAVLDGNLIWRTEWNLEDTQIKLVLSRRGGRVCIGIRYTPVAG